MTETGCRRCCRTVAVAAIGLLVLAASSPALGQTFERNVRRPGGDYLDFDLERASPALCRAACDEDGQCKAWTYVRPGIQGEQARCWLKSVVTEPLSDRCCVSGVKVAAEEVAAAPASRPSQFEQGVNRPGSNFRDYELKQADPASCQRACLQERRCAAWSYVGPGAEGGQAHCWLKEAVPEPVASDGYVSGVKAGAMEQGIDRPGGDYRDLELEEAAPGRCQAACNQDAQCRAWTYIAPGVHGPKARCSLKGEVPPPFENPDCVSGIKVAP